jgi:hypothetical protein
MLDPDSIEHKLSWIHTLMYDVLNELPSEGCKNQLMKAIENVEECENMVEFVKEKKEGKNVPYGLDYGPQSTDPNKRYFKPK